MTTQDSEETLEISDTEMSRRHAVWELFTNECQFLVDRLMVLKHVRDYTINTTTYE